MQFPENYIKIQGIQVMTTVGVHQWEQEKPQKIMINLLLGIQPTPEAFEKDQLDGTIDYAQVVEDLKKWLALHRCQLIEYLAERIVNRLFEQYSTHWVQVEVCKPKILSDTDYVSVCIERSRARLE